MVEKNYLKLGKEWKVDCGDKISFLRALDFFNRMYIGKWSNARYIFCRSGSFSTSADPIIFEQNPLKELDFNLIESLMSFDKPETITDICKCTSYDLFKYMGCTCKENKC